MSTSRNTIHTIPRDHHHHHHHHEESHHDHNATISCVVRGSCFGKLLNWKCSIFSWMLGGLCMFYLLLMILMVNQSHLLMQNLPRLRSDPISLRIDLAHHPIDLTHPTDPPSSSSLPSSDQKLTTSKSNKQLQLLNEVHEILQNKKQDQQIQQKTLLHSQRVRQSPAKQQLRNKVLRTTALQQKPEQPSQHQHDALSVNESRGVMFQNIFYPITVRDPHIIFGMAAQINAKNLAIFIKSLRMTAKSLATVILFVTPPLDHHTTTLITEYEILVIPFDSKSLEPSFLQAYHPSSLRWILIHRLLMENQFFFQKFFQLYLSLDVRDSVFQTNPFHLITPSSPTSRDNNYDNNPVNAVKETLYVFAENDFAIISGCSWNSGWVRDCFGANGLSQIAEQRILCSGVLMSNAYTTLLEYVTVMSNLLSGNSPHETNNRKDPNSLFPKCERNGVDQGAHNYIIHNHLIREPHQVKIVYPLQFPVINLQGMMTVDSVKPINGVILFGGTVPYAIVHQFDRNNDFQTTLAKRYVDWIDWSSSFQSDWSDEPSCQSFLYEQDVDLFRGRCDLAVTSAVTVSDCCIACKAHQQVKRGGDKQCTAFTFVKGSCYLKSCVAAEIAQVVSFFKEELRMIAPSTNQPAVQQGIDNINNQKKEKIDGKQIADALQLKKSVTSFALTGAVSAYLSGASSPHRRMITSK